ncbi:MAG: LytR C-terminal domain-containing protein [Bifidobacteriaceae bacterium]|nr:LytR C-terminal domain-containing protein [Bifidobacteriaceae bacterium]
MRTPSTPESRRRNLRWRQAIIYSLLIGALVVAAATAVGIWTGRLKPMFNDEFKYKPSESPRVEPVPCPSGEGATYPELTAVAVRVLNGTDRQGLAGNTATALAAAGFPAPEPGNAPQTYDGVAKLVTGAEGINNAYTLWLYFPDDAVIAFDATHAGPGVDVHLGAKFQALRPADEVVFDAAAAIIPIDGCRSAESILADLPAAATTTPTP